MLDISKCQDAYYEFSGILSENVRKLAFAGIAIVWIFRQEKNGELVLHDDLKWAILMFVVGLGFDILQYTYQTILWSRYGRYKETKHEKQKLDYATCFLAPRWFNWPANAFLWSKVVCMFLGYVQLALFIF